MRSLETVEKEKEIVDQLCEELLLPRSRILFGVTSAESLSELTVKVTKMKVQNEEKEKKIASLEETKEMRKKEVIERKKQQITFQREMFLL